MKEKIEVSKRLSKAERTKNQFQNELREEIYRDFRVKDKLLKAKKTSLSGGSGRVGNEKLGSALSLMNEEILPKLRALWAICDGDSVTPANYLDSKIRSDFNTFNEDDAFFIGSGQAGILGRIYKNVEYIEAFDVKKAEAWKREMNSKQSSKK